MRATLALNELNRGELKKLFACFDPNGLNVSKFTYVQSEKMMKQLQLQSNTFKCIVLMLRILFFLFKLFYVLTLTLETYSNIDLKTKALLTLYEEL